MWGVGSLLVSQLVLGCCAKIAIVKANGFLKRELRVGAFSAPVWVVLAVVAILALAVFSVMMVSSVRQGPVEQLGRLITIYDGGNEKTILTRARTVADALAEADIEVDASDTVEPGLNSELIVSSYSVNIYRSSLIIVVDGENETRVVTSAQTGRTIAQAADVSMYNEDETVISRQDDILEGHGAIMRVEIVRAVPVNLSLYGQVMRVRTQAKTVAEFLVEKDLTVSENDYLTPSKETPIRPDMEIRIWREGINTVTVEEDVPFETQTIQSNDRPIGYHEIQTPGVNGVRSVTYEIEIRGGVEVGRTEIQSIVVTQPKPQVEIVGIQPRVGALTKSMGVNYFVSSDGVVHRETYYDLPMSVVMQNCGQGGYYTVRADGVKVDRDGYVIIAANLAIYPRCSVVETSLGPGKVYDTGGFVSHHPHGWDIATDWTNNDGR